MKMENCKFHKDKESVTRCKICGSSLCESCEKVYQKYHACPKCVKNQLAFELQNYKRGLKYIIFALVCLLVDLVLFITELAVAKSVANSYLILSIVFFVAFAPFCIWILVRRSIQIKKITELLKLVERAVSNDLKKADKDVANNFEQNLKNDKNK